MQKPLPPGDTQLTNPQIEVRSEEAATFTLYEFLRVIRLRRRMILGVAAMAVVLVTIVTSLVTPMYTASVVVMLDDQKNNVEDVTAVLSGLGDDQTTVQNQVQILTSLELAGKVADKLNLSEDPEFNGKPPENPGVIASLLSAKWLSYLNPLTWLPSASNVVEQSQGVDPQRSALIHRFLKRLTVTPLGVSTAMTVSFQSESPYKAAAIANAVANAYVEDQLDAKFDATQKATQWLSGRIAELSRQAQLADAAVQRYKADHHITMSASGGGSVLDQQIADVSSQLIIARTDLTEKQSNYSRLKELASEGHAADAEPVLESSLISTLRAQEADVTRQVADLSSKYGPRHPKMLDLEAQKADIESKIADEVQRVVDSVKNQVDVASSHVASLENSLRELESEGAGQNQSEVALTGLQSAATSARSMYEAFLGRLNQTQGQEGIQTPDARIISAAEPPSEPSFPRKTLSIGLSIPVGLLLGLLLAFVIERMDTGFRTTAQVEAMIGLPVLATIPEVKGSDRGGGRAADLVIDKPMSSFAEALRGVQLGLTLSNVDRQPKVILLTSSVPGEGKTTLALSLARLASRGGGKAIILDGDLRRPTVAKAMGVTDFKQGLIEALTDPSMLDQCIQKDPRSGTHVLPCLQTPPSPGDLLNSHAMENLIETLRNRYDLVVIDSAPVLPVNDTRILCRLADAMLFVVHWERTPRDTVVHAIRTLADVNAPLAGVVLSRADTERFRHYQYGYQSYYGYYNYNKYYSE